MKNKPNIVFILADQLRHQSLGYNGDTLAKTPHIDKLSKEGVNFTNAVSSMPVCSAFRASLFTGKHVTSTGMVINELRLNPDHHKKCFAHCLNDNGYNTSYIGKWHLYANELGNHYDPGNSFIPPGKNRLGFNSYFAAYNFHHDYYGETAYYHLDSPEKIYFPYGCYEPDGQTSLAINQINELSSESRPFALFLSLGTPHDPWTPDNVPDEYYEQFRYVNFPPPPNYKDEVDLNYGDDWSNIPRTAEQVQEWKRVYYAMVANLDHNVGRIIRCLKENDIEKETIFVFSSDHGECFGAHGRMKKNIFYDEAARIPLLIRYPEEICKNTISDACISNIDFMQTILGMAGIESPEEVEGMDLSECALTGGGSQPDFAFLQNTGACAAWEDGHEWRAVRTKEYTYAVYKVDGKELLFNNRKDPYQMKNLAEDSMFLELKDDLRKKMETKMELIKDDFNISSWYRDNWISEDRKILKTAVSS